ncbi:MAG TPA: hypothetical protein VNG33_16005 [Polyangiaceae bacterium]|nr:hypothetical protein [Polyangiaceae bacterium]
MSFDHWWFGLHIDEAEYERFRPGFAAAAAKALLSPEANLALESWRSRPIDFEEPDVEQLPMSPEKGDLINHFIWAFNLPGFEDFAAEFITGELSDFLTEERVFRFVSAKRNTPVSVLWHALGDARASLLPGLMGNLLLHPRDISEAHDRVTRAYAGTSAAGLFEQAMRYCASNVTADDTLTELISFLPDGLQRARDLGKGFLSLARAQT